MRCLGSLGVQRTLARLRRILQNQSWSVSWSFTRLSVSHSSTGHRPFLLLRYLYRWLCWSVSIVASLEKLAMDTPFLLGVGALIGPTIGSAIWRLRHRNQLAVLDQMDREFFKRIAKNRVDASLQSPTHPVPDYYGAYILSVHAPAHTSSR